MKNIITFLLIAVAMLSACTKNSDLEIKDGVYHLRSPISIDSVMMDSDYWILSHDVFIIVRRGDTIMQHTGYIHNKRYEFFSDGDNPYYPDESFSGGKIVSVDWGFYFFPNSGKTFTLDRE